LTASEALEMGLVNHVSDPVLDYACRIARQYS
jgi:enoyl-CoA hydratase/carnithine racemase